ncbi:MAG: PEGA domain-containing protein [Myxococcales bacterium]
MAHSVSRSELLAGLLAAALLAVASPAFAAKKKKSDGSDAPGKTADGAAQAQDQERPKPILEEAPGPEADAHGNVNFMGARSGKGKITVKAPPAEKAKVYLEGRYFGLAPRTINKIPPGDYILEVNYPNGKSVTKPVSVSGDEEAVVELGGAADVAAPTEKPMPPEKIEKRLGLAKVIGIGAIGLAVVGVGLGAWEYTVQQDYNKKSSAPNQTLQSHQEQDDLARRGDTLALAANVCFIGAGVGLVAAALIGYPAYKARKHGAAGAESGAAPLPVSFMLAPGRTLGSVNAGLTYQF